MNKGLETESVAEVVAALSWPLCRLGEALEVLAQQSGLGPRPVEMPAPPARLSRGETLGPWIEAAAHWLGIEADPVEAPYAEVPDFVRVAGPALVRLSGGDEPRFLALLGKGRRRVALLGPDLVPHHLPVETICSALCRDLETPLIPEINRVLSEAGVGPSRQGRPRTAILAEQLSGQRAAVGWLLRLSPGATVRHQVRQAGLGRSLLALVGAHLAQYLLWIGSWWLIGQGALQGRMDRGWLAAWALLLLSSVPFRLLVTWLQGTFSIRAGALLKQRLLQGALRLVPEEIRHQGVGQLLGRVIESEAVEALAISGGFLGLFASLELGVAGFVLAHGAGGWLQVGLLVGWVGLALLIGWHYGQHRGHWTAERIAMTNDLVERMVGHRTRLAQETPERWHEGEDQAMERFLGLSGAMDRRAAWLLALIPRGWLLVGLLGFAPGFVSAHVSTTQLAVGLGGILLAFMALQKLVAGIWYLADAVIAWRQIAPLFHAAARPAVAGSPNLVFAGQSAGSGLNPAPLLLEAHDLVFRYRDRGEAVLRGCSLGIKLGDRLLLEGSSGSGKSTLAALLAALRLPASGLLLLEGLDLQTLGPERWRRRVGAAPQFHENHILTGTMAFNLLMGLGWPPTPEEVQKAETVCRELGLGDLLERMPAGLLQMVGETGWQLSHGEKSRVYIARALLQEPALLILDESFASLDPENLHRALRAVLDRAATVLVIAHP